MAAFASLARALGFGPRCRVLIDSAEGPLFDRAAAPRRTPSRPRGRLVTADR